MNITELKTPIRIYWDLPAGDSDLACLDIAEQIVRLKILSLDLNAAANSSPQIYLSLLERFSSVPIALSLTIPLSVLTKERYTEILRYRFKNLYLLLDDAAALASINPAELKTAGGPALGISFDVTEKNYLQLPQVYSFCAAHGLSLVLPMQRLLQGGGFFALSQVQRQKLSTAIKEIVKPDKMQVVIHDPFLWRVFFPTLHFPEGSCQAANTMLAISANGDVYPCPSLPVTLGNLKDTDLPSIAHSSEKKGLRERLLKLPTGCDGCIELVGCFGGCRGRGYVATGSWDQPDPGCR